jgi:hypothetical protein
MSNKKNDSKASLDDQELKLFFDALQQEEPEIDPDLSNRKNCACGKTI